MREISIQFLLIFKDLRNKTEQRDFFDLFDHFFKKKFFSQYYFFNFLI
jgi:hypothetical protein